ncbi:MAG: hypothetical protein V1652_01450 [bacterium]
MQNDVQQPLSYELWNFDSAVTLFASTEIEREHYKEILTTIDIENHIAQAIWKLFDENRHVAAIQLGIDDLEVYLATVVVTGVKIDGHHIINPHGFSGKKIEFTMGITFISKAKAVPGKYLFEPGAVYVYSLARKYATYPFVFVWSTKDITALYVATDKRATYIDSFLWGKKPLAQMFQDACMLPEDVSGVVYEQYIYGKVSDHLKRKLDVIFNDSFSIFLRGIGGILKNMSSIKQDAPVNFYLLSFPLPKEIYAKRFLIGGNKVSFVQVAVDPIETFVIEIQTGAYAELNQIAGRRVKWLMNA